MDILTRDSVWYQMRFDEGEEITHAYNGGKDYSVTFNDWLFKQETLPLENIVSMKVKNKEIPIIRITLDDYPDAESLWEKDLYLNAKIKVEGNGYYEDTDTLQLSIKGRGNSTWRMSKKPMRLKFPKKVSLAGLKKAKSYVLLNNRIDPSMMRNALSMWIARSLGVPYANEMVPCHVFLNGHYLGAYTLTHKIGLNSGSVDDIDEETGILMELSTEMDEKYCFTSKTSKLPVMVKDPDFDELYEEQVQTDSLALTPEERLALWQKDFENAETRAIWTRSAAGFDIESFVNYVLLYDLSINGEIRSPKSIFLHKDNLQAGSKYKFGPAWDFDICYNSAVPGIAGSSAPYNITTPYQTLKLPRLFDSIRKLTEVDSYYVERFRYFENNIFYPMLDFIDEYSALIETSAEMEGKRWPGEGALGDWGYIISASGHTRHVNELKDWIVKRVKFLHSIYIPREPFPTKKEDEGVDNPGGDEGGDNPEEGENGVEEAEGEGNDNEINDEV